VNIGVLRSIAAWVTRMLRMFGLAEGSAASVSGAIGWGRASSANGENLLVDVGNNTNPPTKKKPQRRILTARRTLSF
jgi:hypothetical protein